MNSLSRRKFLKISGATIATAAVVASSAKTVVKAADKINKKAVKGIQNIQSLIIQVIKRLTCINYKKNDICLLQDFLGSFYTL